MAYYDYQCEQCRQRFTVQQSFAQHDRRPKPKCSKCRSQQVRRLIEAVHLKTTKKS